MTACWREWLNCCVSESRGNWAAALERHRASLARDMTGTATEIRDMFDGMGSLNDIVLFRDGLLLHQENDEFNSLRSRLYELVR